MWVGCWVRVVNPGLGHIYGVIYGCLEVGVDSRNACERDVYHRLETVALSLWHVLVK